MNNKEKELDSKDLIRSAFEAYNRRDSTALLAMVTDDVSWPGEAAELKGKSELQAFWESQWSVKKTVDIVLDIRRLQAADYVVLLDQTVTSLDGDIMSTGRFNYTFAVRHGRISALRSREAVK